MKRLLGLLGIFVIGATLATPVFAGHRDRNRGHGRHTHPHLRGRICRVVHVAPRPRVGLHFGLGYPGLYAGAVVYQPVPILVPAQVWVPGHYVRDDGVRFWIAGHWSR